MNLSRRTLVGAGAASLFVPALAFGATTSKRLVVVVLRGGMDGLAAAPPVGDPAYASARGVLAQQKAQTLALDATFALHPRFENLHAMYRAGDAAVIHATCTPYRERSHFDAQNVLETGGVRPYARNAGWLNAALRALPAERAAGRRELGLALAQQAPLILRGDASVATWSPSPLPDANTDTVARLMDLYGRRDPGLATALQSAVAANGIAMDGAGLRAGGRAIAPVTKAAAQFLKLPQGPVAAVVEMGGWDTHANQGAEAGQLANNFALLDQGLAALKSDLGETWRDTVVVVMTEFGRTVAPNGNRGCDHGTGAAAFLLGGAVRGGRVIADWPGLAPNQLNEGRDLRATTDLRAVLKGVVRDHLGVSDANAFPDSAAVRPVDGLLKG
ncbi:MAG: DUF1501 domain-containing protein [Hyphomonadaceae bacterium]|nr:MAG: hypothetical protein FD160_1326 [Caulobacteraceae bacterium]MBT9446244.1 DUF1501 domain-containing protein [Hyphomonadaceae bacterium]TPW07180.1 MAG: hypothetical protein FD124_1325 [Alphaproteobacteria bacterium]